MVHTTTLGGSAKDIAVAKVGTGLMMLTWTPTPTPDEQAFEAIKAAIDAVPAGSKMLLNSSQFYAQDFSTANLELLARFFDKHPGYADKVFLSVKGGTKPNSVVFDDSPEGIRTSVELCVKALRGTKKIDLFENARVTRETPLSKQYEVLKGLVDEGLIGHIGLSECSAATIREVNEIVPVAAVEIEVSPWSYEEETKKVIATCAELGIAVVAYSPLGRGFLTGELTKLPEGDMRNRFTRFQGENFNNNFRLVEALKNVAEKKGITPAQLCLAWVQSLGERVIPIPGSSKASRVIDNIKTSDIKFTSAELAKIDRILKEIPVSGGRYMDSVSNDVLHLWG
ncbi:aldo/keto reductase [Peniophora sp. CONT]|nr:aldo/keto reductase [Peniophora sp. CONT]